MTHVDTDVKHCAAELLFVLCKENGIVSAHHSFIKTNSMLAHLFLMSEFYEFYIEMVDERVKCLVLVLGRIHLKHNTKGRTTNYN